MPNLRLCRETDTIEDPPAPLPFNSIPSWRAAGEQVPKEDAMDSIQYAQSALSQAENKLAELTELVEEEIDQNESFVFARWNGTDHDDDGPYAA